MSCSLKRKLEESDEEREDEGMDRKHLSVPSGPTKPTAVHQATYSLQRQKVFNLSLLKLCSTPALTDPGLERRVLITNTLRLLQEEFKQEGEALSPPLNTPPSVTLPHLPEEGREPPSGFGNSPFSTPEASLTPAYVLEEDGHVLLTLQSSGGANQPHSTSRPQNSSVVSRDSFSAALSEIEGLCPVAMTMMNSSPPLSSAATSSLSPPPFSSPGSSVGADESAGSSPSNAEGFVAESPSESSSDSSPRLSLTDPAPLSHDPPTSSACPSPFPNLLTDLAFDDFLFSDIDGFTCDFNPCGSPLGSGSVVSMVTDDLVRTLSVYGGGGNAPGPLPSNQSFKMDLNELDHIMEVLVGS
ncbi:SERTA domain-containing protein 2 [Chanos chanos]|uniref:SERTA domain-containing protein 2 n=1 Tax=Chanos chanos TaxID=29144 RepID=A0A6J2VS30_CHACN|nr:SERTA domain-containing protein 2-like [Chanos chanos]